MHNKILKNICWAMAFILFFTWSGIPQNAAYAQKTARLNGEERKRAVEKLEKLFNTLEEAAKEIPRDTFDPQAILDKVGKDPIKLFEWVRDNTYLVPYRGTLRGPIGVLMDRLGNSLDRALLLHELLTIAGHKARLARGTLSRDQAEMVLNKARPIPLGGALPAEEEPRRSMDEFVTKYTEKYGLNPHEMQRAAKQFVLTQQHLKEEVAQRVQDQTKAILKLVGEPKIDIRAAERVKAIEALQDHCWVQWKGASGWIALDSTLPAAKPAQTLVEVATTHRPDDIKEALQHLVKIRVIIERWQNPGLEEEQVLEHTLRPSNLFGKQIFLQHVYLNWPDDFDLLSGEKPLQRLKKILLKEKEWLPVLTVGSEQIAKHSFTDRGEVKNDPNKRATSPDQDFDRGVVGLFGGITGRRSTGVSRDELKAGPQLTAEWIEYEISAPGEPPRTIRRQIFDIVGPAARRNKNAHSLEISDIQRLELRLALFGETVVLPQPCRFSGPFVMHSFLANFLHDADFLLTMLRNHTSDKTSTSRMQDIGRLEIFPGLVYSLAFTRWELNSPKNYYYLDRPNIFSLHRRLWQSGKNDINYQPHFDIVENYVATYLAAHVNFFSKRLEQGILDTNTEQLIASSAVGASAAFDSYSLSTALDLRWILIDDARDPDFALVKLSDDTRARIENHLDMGYSVITPERPLVFKAEPVIRWWLIDNVTGQMLEIGKCGWGVSFTDYGLTLQSRLKAWLKANQHFIAILLFTYILAACTVDNILNRSEAGLIFCALKTACAIGGYYGWASKTVAGFSLAFLLCTVARNIAEHVWGIADHDG